MPGENGSRSLSGRIPGLSRALSRSSSNISRSTSCSWLSLSLSSKNVVMLFVMRCSSLSHSDFAAFSLRVTCLRTKGIDTVFWFDPEMDKCGGVAVAFEKRTVGGGEGPNSGEKTKGRG